MTAPSNPFDVLPPTLFNVFSSQGGLQRHYLAILLRIYGMAEFNRFGLTREMVVAEVVDYLNSDEAEGIGRLSDVADGFSSEDDFEDETNASETQNYAGWILRRLIDAGWLEQEQQADYTESSSCPYRRRTRWKPGCANTRSARRMQNEATDPYPADQLAPL